MKRMTRPEPSPGEAARLGEELRDARLALGLAIEDIARSLRIRRVYLVALEEGRLRDLPAPAYALGFVRSYARLLGLDEAEFVRRFREQSGPAVQRKQDLVFPEPVPERGVPAGAVVLVGGVLAAFAYIGWYQWSGSGTRTVDAVPPVPAREAPPPALAAPALAPGLPSGPASAPAGGLGGGLGATPAGTSPGTPAGAPAATPAGTPPGAAPPGGGLAVGPQRPNAAPSPVSAGASGVSGALAPAPAAASAAPRPVAGSAPPPSATPPAPSARPAGEDGRVVLRAKAEVWIQVRDPRSGVLVNRVLRPGESYAVPARDGLLLSTGNAAGLDVLVDGQPAPGLGGAGQNVRRDVPMDPDRLKSATAARPAQ